jgi:hypothetical protein
MTGMRQGSGGLKCNRRGLSFGDQGAELNQRQSSLFFAAGLLVVVLAIGCTGGGGGSDGEIEYDEENVVAIVQGWPLLHPNDYACGTATIQERTIISVIARIERLDFETGCGPESNGTAARRAVRLVLTDTAWTAEEDSGGVWNVHLDPGTGRTYDWIFLESGPQLLASGGDALLWPLFNWSDASAP